MALHIAFAQPHTGEWRVREHAVGNQPVARGSLRSGQIISNDPEVVEGYVRELWAAGAFPHRPDLGRTRLQPLVDPDIATTVQLDTGHLKPDPGAVRNAPGGDQDIAALDSLLTGGRADEKTDSPSGSALHAKELGRQ